MTHKIALITGVNGQDGSYLAELLIAKGYEVHGILRRSSIFNTARIEHLYIDDLVEDMHKKRKLSLHYGDMTDSSSLVRIIQEVKPDEIYNLAAQSHVKVSFEIPEYTANSDAIGTLRVLEAIRILGLEKKTRVYQASTSELYGMVQEIPQSESTPFYPRSPYAVAKQYAFWITKNYREAYGIYAVNGILFNHESHLRTDTFFVKKVIREAIKIKNGISHQLHVGNLNIKRDIGYAPQYVEAMFKMMQQPKADSYLICTGSSVSLQYIVEYVFNKLDVPASKIIVDQKLFRPSEIHDIYGSNKHINTSLNWHYTMTIEDLLNILVEEELQHFIN